MVFWGVTVRRKLKCGQISELGSSRPSGIWKGILSSSNPRNGLILLEVPRKYPLAFYDIERCI